MLNVSNLSHEAVRSCHGFVPSLSPYFHCIVCYQNVGYVCYCYVRFFYFLLFVFFVLSRIISTSIGVNIVTHQ